MAPRRGVKDRLRDFEVGSAGMLLRSNIVQQMTKDKHERSGRRVVYETDWGPNLLFVPAQTGLTV